MAKYSLTVKDQMTTSDTFFEKTDDVDVTENCFDWGEVPSIVLRNLTKEI